MKKENHLLQSNQSGRLIDVSIDPDSFYYKRQGSPLLLLTAALLLTAPIAHSLPLDTDSRVRAGTNLSGWFISDPAPAEEMIEDRIEATSSQSREVSETNYAQSGADLSTGQMRTMSGAEMGLDWQSISSTAFSELLDVFVFSDTTTINFGLDVNGTMSVDTTTGVASSLTNLRFYDVTNVEYMFDPDTPWGTSNDFLGSNILSTGSFAQVYGESSTPQAPIDNLMDFRYESSDGEAVPFSFYIEDSIDVIAGNAYAVLIDQTTRAANLRGDFYGDIGEVSADLYNTSTFGFNNLGDTTFASASGVFPGASGSIGSSTPVPAPGMLWLFVTGLAGLMFTRARKR